MVKEETKHN